jgi:glycosyltransferase involved in cell wall biosynthesis
MAHNYYQQPGGEDVSFAAEVELLRRHGHDVICYTRHNDEIEAMRPLALAGRTLWNGASAREARALVVRTQPDIVHVHNTFPLLSPSFAESARQAGVPVVQTLHNYRMICPKAQLFRDGLFCEQCAGHAVAWPAIVHACYRGDRRATSIVVGLNALQRTRLGWTRSINRFIVLTDDARARLAAGGLPAERMVVKPNFLPCDPGVGAGVGGYALYAGRLSPEKGVRTLLDAWKALSAPLPLKIAGDGPLAGNVRQAAAGDTRIEALGWRAHDEILELLQGAAFLVLPSLWVEGLPHTMIESFAVGTPVLASRLGSMRELVRNGATGLHFAAGNAHELVERINWLLEHPVERGAMRVNARCEYEQRYTAERNYELLTSIYRDVLARRSR